MGFSLLRRGDVLQSRAEMYELDINGGSQDEVTEFQRQRPKIEGRSCQSHVLPPGLTSYVKTNDFTQLCPTLCKFMPG